MRSLDLRVAARQLRAEPLHATVLIVGLGLAFSACYLLALLLGERLRPDPALHEPERIVLIDFHGNMPGRAEDWFLGAPFVFKQALQDARAPLHELTRVSEDEPSLSQGHRKLRARVLAADASAVSLFQLRSLQGDLQQALSQPDSIALSASLAQRLFGQEPALGRSLDLGPHRLRVAAILPEPSSRSLLQAEAWISFDSPAAGLDDETRQAWFQINGQVYGRLAAGASTEQVGALAQALLDQSPVIQQLPADWTAGGRKAAFMRALPVTQLPFEGRAGKQRLQVLSALAGVALLLLCLALLNHVKLSSVRTLQRQREIAVRKALGLSPARLLLQFAVEAQLIIALALGLALLLAWLLLPWASQALQVPQPDQLLQWQALLGLLLACALLSLLVCLYPAQLAWRLHTAAALQGRQASESPGGRGLRRALTGLQFAMALLAVSAALTLNAQNQHVLSRDLGFDPRGVITLRLPDQASDAQAQDLQQALRRSPDVEALVGSDSVPGSAFIDRNAEFTRDGQQAKLRFNEVEPAFFELYRMAFLAGQIAEERGATAPGAEGDGLVLDLAACQALGWATPEQALGQTLSMVKTGLNQSHSPWRVVAVVANQRLESTREDGRPHAFLLRKQALRFNDGRMFWVLHVRLKAGANPESVLAPLWQRYFPGEPLAWRSAEEVMMSAYQSDLRVTQLIGACGGLALLLAGLGVYVLAAFLVQAHAKEIVLRKLHGATPLQAMRSLFREFALLLVAAALLALPLSALLGERYLAQFPDRVSLNGGPQLWALGGLLLVTLLASWRHSWAALAMRPVMALRL